MEKDINILVVEDTDYQTGIYKFQLNGLGYKNITSAENGAEAFSLLEKDSFDLIVSDYDMPVMNGLDFLRKVRNSPPHQHIPFIMITGMAGKDTHKLAVEEGVTEFLVKPVNNQVLDERIKKVFD